MNNQDKETSELSAMTNTTIQLTKVDMNGQVFYSQFAFNLMIDKQKTLEAENKKLRDALESIANSKNYPEPDYLIAREALKEVGEK